MQLSRELKLPYGRPCKVKIEIGQPENFKKVFESDAILEESYFSLFLAKSFSYYVPSIEKISHVRITCDEKISLEEKIKYMSDSINGYWVSPWIGFEKIVISENKLPEFST
jgi:hypothetical protein